jgi:hypothetical protein
VRVLCGHHITVAEPLPSNGRVSKTAVSAGITVLWKFKKKFAVEFSTGYSIILYTVLQRFKRRLHLIQHCKIN